jgi:signal transduction histidine kinase
MPVEQQRRFIGNLLVDTVRIRQLVNRLLELARADAIDASPKACQLQAILAGLQSQFYDRNLALCCENALDYRLAIAPEVLEMALYNLLENSVQHKAKRVDITLVQQDNRLLIQLLDDGTGVSDDNQGKIFTPFFTTRRNTGGTGLGLAITVSLLKAYHGTVELQPSSKGALFWVTLCLAERA